MASIERLLYGCNTTSQAIIEAMKVEVYDGSGPPARHAYLSRPPKTTLEEMIAKFTEEFSGVRPFFISHSGNDLSIQSYSFFGDGVFIVFEKFGSDVILHIDATSLDTLKQIFDFFVANTDPEKSRGSVFMLVQGTDELSFDSIGIGGMPLIRENYSQDVLAGYDHFMEEMSTQDPCGRLFIITGPPGGGKTHLIKGMLHSNLANYAFVPTTMLPSIAGPQIISAVKKFRNNNGTKPLVLVIEDADDCLCPRGPDNMASISTLLNASEGILGQIMDVRIVATTNAKSSQIDAAVLREGRLCARAHVDELSAAHASSVLSRLLGREATTGKSMLSGVYREARRLGWSPVPGKLVIAPAPIYDAVAKRVGFY